MMKILLQFPEGLKPRALELAKKYEDDGHHVYLSASKCFGGCDIAYEEAKIIGADKIVHFGHAPFHVHPKFKELGIEVEYIEFPIDVPDELVAKLVVHAHKYKRICLTTVVQHIHRFVDIKKAIEAKGTEVVVSRGSKTAYPGQTLGCDAVAATSLESGVDAVYFIGGGRFHYLAFHHGIDSMKVPVYLANVYTQEITDVTKDIANYLKQRRGMLAKASEAKTFGILVSTRSGQFSPAMADLIQSRLTAKGRRAYVLVSYTIDSEALQDFNSFDAYINTACPRLCDDWESIGKPIVNMVEFEHLLELI